MVTLGPNSPATFADIPATVPNAWNTPSNAAVSDGVYTTSSVGTNSDTDFLVVTNFAFSVPSSATINGILVEIERKDLSNQAVDNIVQIVQGGTAGGTNMASASTWPTTEAYQTYGGSSSLWGLSWLPSDINSSNFGVSLQGFSTAVNSLSVDHIRITVYYTPGPPTLTGLSSLTGISSITF
jgi:hypothetical protein